MQALVDKSLLRRWIPDSALPRHDIDEPYFGMYLSIHEYAAQKCGARGDVYLRGAEQRHGRYFAAFGTDEALEALFAHGGMERMRALRRELDNLALGMLAAPLRAPMAPCAVACYRAAVGSARHAGAVRGSGGAWRRDPRDAGIARDRWPSRRGSCRAKR